MSISENRQPQPQYSPEQQRRMDIMVIENKTKSLFFAVGAQLTKFGSFSVLESKQILRGSRNKDVYLTLHLKHPKGAIIQIRAYVEDMVLNPNQYQNGEYVHLTGYFKLTPESRPSSIYALEQGWYAANPAEIAGAIINRNPNYLK